MNMNIISLAKEKINTLSTKSPFCTEKCLPNNTFCLNNSNNFRVQRDISVEKSKLLSELHKSRREHNIYSSINVEIYTFIQKVSELRAAKYRDGECYCYASNDYLAAKFGISKRRIQQCLKQMEDMGWIIREKNYKNKFTFFKRKKTKKEIVVGRKIFPIFKFKIYIELKRKGESDFANIDKNAEQKCAISSPEKNQNIDVEALNNTYADEKDFVTGRKRFRYESIPECHENIDVEAPKNCRNFLIKPSSIKNNNNITIATTTTIEEKNAQNKNEEKVAAKESDIFSQNEKTLDFASQKEKVEQKTDLESKKCLPKTQTKSKNQLYKICILRNTEGKNVHNSQNIVPLKDEFFNLAKTYYEKHKFTGLLRPLMAKDFKKAREQYIRLCLAGVTNKDAVMCEIDDYLHWLKINKGRRKQKLWSFMVSPYRDWEAAKETARIRKINWEKDLETKFSFIDLDPFDTPEEKAALKEKLKNAGFINKTSEKEEKYFFDMFDGPEIKSEDENLQKKSLPTKQLEKEFEEIWAEYPRKLGKENAKKDFFKFRNEGVTFEEILNGVKKYYAYVVENQIEDRFIKHGSTWLHQKSWQDVYETDTKQAYEKAMEAKKRAEEEAYLKKYGIVEYG